jgi:general secretion pathway protein I
VRKSALNDRRGFTLIEVLIAVVIMAGGIIVMANAWSGNFLRVRNSRINNTAAALLERKMTEIEILYKDKPIDDVKDEDGGDFGSMFPGYAWKMSSKQFEMPDISGSLVAREGGADEMLLTIVKTTTDFINKSVKEVSVTVSFKPKVGNEIRHTVATYFVDYTKEMDIPGMPGGAGAAAPGAAAPPKTTTPPVGP